MRSRRSRSRTRGPRPDATLRGHQRTCAAVWCQPSTRPPGSCCAGASSLRWEGVDRDSRQLGACPDVHHGGVAAGVRDHKRASHPLSPLERRGKNDPLRRLGRLRRLSRAGHSPRQALSLMQMPDPLPVLHCDHSSHCGHGRQLLDRRQGPRSPRSSTHDEAAARRPPWGTPLRHPAHPETTKPPAQSHIGLPARGSVTTRA
jgi:hypothetical protein